VRRVRAITVMMAGFALIVAALGYDLIFAGLPYQDPTTEMQANWLFHKEIASKAILGGAVIFLAGFVWALVKFSNRVFSKRG